LAAELARLEDEDRPTVAGASADDVQAKRQLELIDQRIQYLRQCLGSARIMPPPEEPGDIVGFGAIVTLRDGAEEARYRIVGAHETDLDCGRVSWLSPIGRALIGARLGQRVTFRAPSGRRELEILHIEYER
jgi:transcription elongation factor GreB